MLCFKITYKQTEAKQNFPFEIKLIFHKELKNLRGYSTVNMLAILLMQFSPELTLFDSHIFKLHSVYLNSSLKYSRASYAYFKYPQ